MIKLSFKRYSDYMEKWQKCSVEDLICVDHGLFINGEEYELSQFIKILIKTFEEASGKSLVEFLE